ncbi:MAG: sugar transferase [Geobacteraceae bacterium]
MKRLFDISLSVSTLILMAIPMIIIALFVKLTTKGPVLYWSDRVGRNNILFRMPKFRTMSINTPEVATNLLGDPDRYLTRIGCFLRKFSLDELPQLLCILKGEMSFVGPRPALFNQVDLIELRTLKGVQHLIPGLTGWAQINGRDELPLLIKVDFDEQYLKNYTFTLDLQIIFRTVIKVFKREGILH